MKEGLRLARGLSLPIGMVTQTAASRDTCVHYVAASGRCRAHAPTCAHHNDGACRVAGKLEEHPPPQSYGIRFTHRPPAGSEQRK